MARPKNPLLSKTERLLGNLMDMAITQSSKRGPQSEEEVASDQPRMTVTEMRGVLETSIRWQSMKAKIEPPAEDGPSDFEGIVHEFDRAEARARKERRSNSRDAAALNGVAADAEGVDGATAG